MVLSKFLLCCVGFIIGAEIYHQAALKLKKRLLPDDDFNEMIFTRDPLDYKTKLTRHINFSREKTLHVMEMLENLILSGRKCIHVAMYIFTSDPLATALIQAHKRGLQVFVIVDHSMENSSSSKVVRLKEAGVAVRICHEKTLHHKMCLIDVPFKGSKPAKLPLTRQTIPIPSNGLVISGSCNWTRDALTNNEEYLNISSTPALCQRAVKKFLEIWSYCET